MDIAERRVPQDGRFMVRIGAQSVDVRISTLPTQYGEKIVMRMLNSDGGLVNFAETGMPGEVEETFREVLNLPRACCWSPDPPARARAPCCARPRAWFASHPQRGHRRSPSNMSCPASTRCRSTRKPASASPVAAFHPAPGPQRRRRSANSRQGNRRNRHEGGADHGHLVLSSAHQ